MAEGIRVSSCQRSLHDPDLKILRRGVARVVEARQGIGGLGSVATAHPQPSLRITEKERTKPLMIHELGYVELAAVARLMTTSSQYFNASILAQHILCCYALQQCKALHEDSLDSTFCALVANVSIIGALSRHRLRFWEIHTCKSHRGHFSIP